MNKIVDVDLKNCSYVQPILEGPRKMIDSIDEVKWGKQKLEKEIAELIKKYYEIGIIEEVHKIKVDSFCTNQDGLSVYVEIIEEQ